MRIESVTAHAFGPFRGERLDLAPGMTVVGGPNEAGKSSWHAALRAAICGVRRGRGHATTEEQEFADLHRPWDTPEEWAVSARLALDQGPRLVEIRQDLAGKIASSVIELPLGRRISDEIMNDGSPDASIWLGLDRYAFARTICVDQADLLAVTRAAGQLQEHLQRAAATQGTDATAAEALDRLRRFRAEAVGLDRAGAVRPLRQAIGGLESARAALAAARVAHESYLELQAEADDARLAYEKAAIELRLAEAAVAAREADWLAQQAARAHLLSERHPVAPAGVPERDELADAVAGALDGWSNRPEIPDLEGEGSDALAARLAAVPEAPAGDLEVHESVRAAWEGWTGARAVLDRLLQKAPPGPAPETGGLSAANLDALASDLTAESEVGDLSLERALADARLRGGALRRPTITAAAGAAILVVVAFAALAAGATALGLAGLLGGLILTAATVVLWRRRSVASRDRADAEAALEPARIATAAAAARRREATRTLEAAGLPPDPETLRGLARDLEDHDAAVRAEADREQQRVRAAEREKAAAGELRDALRARGPMEDGDLAAALAAYERACAERARAAAQAAQGDALRAALASRLEAEKGAEAARQRVAEASAALLLVAGQVGLDATGLDEVQAVAALHAWQVRQTGERTAQQEALIEWEELRALLDGSTVEMLEGRARKAADRAASAADGLDPAALATARLEPDAAARLAVLREAERGLLTRARDLEGRRAERAGKLLDVAAAEETVDRAEAELARVRRLEQTLDSTIELLTEAQEQVHRDLAPILAEAVRPGLAAVTAGRYGEVAIDPSTLAIQARETATGLWRDARRLSQGTREQVYLLLRAAMAQHLVTTGETAPLLLDEVTAQSDDARRREVLAVLHELSLQRQVILFTHDDDVVMWARAQLDPGRDRLIELPAPTG